MLEDGSLKAVTQGVATLSSDARVIDESTSVQFLQEFSDCMNDPESMII